MTPIKEDSGNNNSNNSKKSKEVILIATLIGIPILVALVAVGGPAIINGIKNIFTAIVPNFWVVLTYIYIAVVAFVVGRRLK